MICQFIQRVMLTKQVIENIYKKFRKRPATPDELNIALLFGEVFDNHDIYIDENNLVINSVDESPPFHSIPLDRIHQIVDFETVVAIVLHSSIIFLNKHDGGVNVHLKTDGPSLLDRIHIGLSR